MLKGQKKHIDKEQGKTKHEAPRSANYRATQNKIDIGTGLSPFLDLCIVNLWNLVNKISGEPLELGS